MKYQPTLLMTLDDWLFRIQTINRANKSKSVKIAAETLGISERSIYQYLKDENGYIFIDRVHQQTHLLLRTTSCSSVL